MGCGNSSDGDHLTKEQRRAEDERVAREMEEMKQRLDTLSTELESERSTKMTLQAELTAAKNASARAADNADALKKARIEINKLQNKITKLQEQAHEVSETPGVAGEVDPRLLAKTPGSLTSLSIEPSGRRQSKRESLLETQVLSLKKSLRTMQDRQTQIKKEHAEELSELREKGPEYLQQLYVEKVQFERELLDLKKQSKQVKFDMQKSIDELTQANEQLKSSSGDSDQELVALKQQITQLNAKVDKINQLKKTAEEEGFELAKKKDGEITRLKRELAEQRKKLAEAKKAIPDSAAAAGSESGGAGGNKPKKVLSLFGAGKAGSTGPKPTTDPKAALDALIAKKRAASPKAGAEAKSDEGKSTVVSGEAAKGGNLNALLQKHKSGGGMGSTPSSLSQAATKYAKYDKMKKVGLPEGAVRSKMKTDGFSDEDIAKYFGDPLPKKKNGGGGSAKVDLSKHDLSKYDRMKKVGLPPPAVRNKMTQDGIDKKVIAAYFGDPMPDDGEDDDDDDEEEMKAPDGPPPDMSKYERMKKVSLPEPAIRNKMKQDKIHEYYVCKFFGDPLPKVAKTAPPPTPKPDFAKYEKMKKVSLPPPAIRNKMKQDGIHEYWICFFFGDPLPTLGGGSKKKKKPKKPKRKVKPLHWRKKSDCDWNETLWSKMKMTSAEEYFDEDMCKLMESSFAIVDKKKKKGSGKGGAGSKEKKEPEEISLLDGKRSFNITVGLSRVGMTDWEMRDSLLSMDESKIDADMIQKIAKYMPTNEELRLVKDFKGDKEKLARAEKLFLRLSVMQDIPLRLQLWEFKLTFAPKEQDLERKINIVRDALFALSHSRQMIKFMEVCLLVGNWMNEGTIRGEAKGFRMETFDRFNAMKTADNKLSMLEFIIRFCRNGKDKEEFEGFPESLMMKLEPVYRIDSKTIRDAVTDMEDSLKRIGKRIKRANRNITEMQSQFNSRAGAVFRVFGKLRRALAESREYAESSEEGHSVVEKLRKYRAKKKADAKQAHKESLMQPSERGPRMKRATTAASPTLSPSNSETVPMLADMERSRTATTVGASMKDDIKAAEDAVNAGPPPSDRFELVMTGFHTRSELRVQNMKQEYEELKQTTEKLCVFYGEPDDLEWESLFKIFKKFFELFQKAEKKLADIEKRKEKERKKKEREAKAAARRAAGKGRKKVAAKGEPEPVNILEEIKMRKAKGKLAPSTITEDDPKASLKKKSGVKKTTDDAGGGGGGLAAEQLPLIGTILITNPSETAASETDTDVDTPVKGGGHSPLPMGQSTDEFMISLGDHFSRE